MKYLLKLWLCRIVSAIGVFLAAVIAYALLRALLTPWLAGWVIPEGTFMSSAPITWIAAGLVLHIVIAIVLLVAAIYHVVVAVDDYGWRGLWDGRACGIRKEVKQ